MRIRVLMTGVALFVVGLAVGLSTPTTAAQTVAGPCAASWVIEHGPERRVEGADDAGFYALKLNRCTGDAYVFASDDMKVSEKDVWYKLGVAPQ